MKSLLPTNYYYETIKMDSQSLPIRIHQIQSDQTSVGCEVHWHEELEFYYVKKGAVCLLCNGQKRWIHAGQVGFVNWCQLHRGAQFLDHTEHYIIQLGSSLFEQEMLAFPDTRVSFLALLLSCQNQLPLVFEDSTELTPWLDLLLAHSQSTAPASQLLTKSAIYGTFSFLVGQTDSTAPSTTSVAQNQPSMEHLKQILFYVAGHYHLPQTVTLSALSARFGVSVPYLCRIFKQYTNQTLGAYLIALRCQRACMLIQEGTELSQVALSVGYSDYNYFSRLFKKQLGVSPSCYQLSDKETAV